MRSDFRNHETLTMACLGEGAKEKTRADWEGTRVGKAERRGIKAMSPFLTPLPNPAPQPGNFPL